MPTYPHLRVTGSARERGRQYGEQARERVARTVATYQEVFASITGLTWSDAREYASRFAQPIAAFGAKYLEEMRGIAEGAALDLEDVLAINVRTEVMYSARARQADVSSPRECTSFALVPPPGGRGDLIIGQNWDWLPHAFETLVVLEARQDEGPNFVTVVEAGLLAKTGMNQFGLGLVTNALACNRDRGDAGVPYHVWLRAILDQSTVADSLGLLQRSFRSSSANYLIATDDGAALDVEATPGGYERLHVLTPREGLLAHTNHFLAPRFADDDVSLWTSPDSPVRLSRFEAGIAHGARDVDGVIAVLRDHAGYPFGICSHPDPRVPSVEQGATIATIVMDLSRRRLFLADGQPCVTPTRELDLGDLLSPDEP